MTWVGTRNPLKKQNSEWNCVFLRWEVRARKFRKRKAIMTRRDGRMYTHGHGRQRTQKEAGDTVPPWKTKRERNEIKGKTATDEITQPTMSRTPKKKKKKKRTRISIYLQYVYMYKYKRANQVDIYVYKLAPRRVNTHMFESQIRRISSFLPLSPSTKMKKQLVCVPPNFPSPERTTTRGSLKRKKGPEPKLKRE